MGPSLQGKPLKSTSVSSTQRCRLKEVKDEKVQLVLVLDIQHTLHPDGPLDPRTLPKMF